MAHFMRSQASIHSWIQEMLLKGGNQGAEAVAGDQGDQQAECM